MILLDVGMPRWIGYEACRRIREQPWGRRTVDDRGDGVGAGGGQGSVQGGGFNFHLVKPLDPDALDRLLAGLLLTPA